VRSDERVAAVQRWVGGGIPGGSTLFEEDTEREHGEPSVEVRAA
jgi:hypothetical protein